MFLLVNSRFFFVIIFIREKPFSSGNIFLNKNSDMDTTDL